jgi:hypothetical protein
MRKFKSETDEHYGNRLIYSATAAWIRTALLGKSYSDIEVEHDECGVDIMHLITRLTPVVSSLISVIPHCENWFVGNNISQKANFCIGKIISNMKLCNEIAVLNNRRRLTVTSKRILRFGDISIVLGGVDWQIPNSTITTFGFGRWIQKQSKSSSKLDDELGMPELSAQNWLDKLLKDVLWSNKKLEGDFKLFAPGAEFGHMSWLRDSWEVCTTSSLPQGVSLIRNNIGAYFLIRKSGDIIKSVLLDQWYSKTKELYRIMYALDVKSGKPRCFEATIYEDYVIAHIHSHLPKAEEKLVLLSSWPYKGISDPYRRVIPMPLWPGVKRAIENIGVKWKVNIV